MTALTESKRKKKRWRSLAMCVWTVVSWGVGLTSTFGSLSYNQGQTKTHGMVRSACFLAATISFSASFFFLFFSCHGMQFSNPYEWFAFAFLRPVLLRRQVARTCMHPSRDDTHTAHTRSIVFKLLHAKVECFLPVR